MKHLLKMVFILDGVIQFRGACGAPGGVFSMTPVYFVTDILEVDCSECKASKSGSQALFSLIF